MPARPPDPPSTSSFDALLREAAQAAAAEVLPDAEIIRDLIARVAALEARSSGGEVSISFRNGACCRR